MGLVRSPVWGLDNWDLETVLSLDGKRRHTELRRSTDISLARAVVELGRVRCSGKREVRVVGAQALVSWVSEVVTTKFGELLLP